VEDYKDELMICSCGSLEHQLVFRTFDDGEVFMSVHLTKHSFFRRLKHGIKYILGYQCRYGAFDEVILDSRYAQKFMDISFWLSKHEIKKEATTNI